MKKLFIDITIGKIQTDKHYFMSIQPDQLYHYYNQGNNRQRLFYSKENKLYFLRNFRKHIYPHCNVLAYCLMDNHFHFLIHTNEKSTVMMKVGNLVIPAISNGFRVLTSVYAQAINRQENRKGALFRAKTQYKLLSESEGNYPFVCFQYIHQNPMTAGLVEKMEDWEFSSFRDYMGMREGTLCNQEIAYQLLDISISNFYGESYKVIPDEKVRGLYN